MMLTSSGSSPLCPRKIQRDLRSSFRRWITHLFSPHITMLPVYHKRHLYREEYTGRWTNVNIFTGALTLGRMIDITKPDGQVIPCQQSFNRCANNHHSRFCHFNQHSHSFLPIPEVSILILNTLFANQECGRAGDFLSWTKVVFL